MMTVRVGGGLPTLSRRLRMPKNEMRCVFIVAFVFCSPSSSLTSAGDYYDESDCSACREENKNKRRPNMRQTTCVCVLCVRVCIYIYIYINTYINIYWYKAYSLRGTSLAHVAREGPHAAVTFSCQGIRRESGRWVGGG